MASAKLQLAVVPILVGLVVVIIFAVFATMTAPTSESHGTGVQLNRREFAGAYEVALGIVPDPPRVAEIFITIAVIEQQTRAIVMNADVTLTGKGPNSVTLGPLVVETDPLDPTFYDLSTHLTEVGTWEFTVNISAHQGPGLAYFTIEVVDDSPLTGILTLITLLAFLSILGLSGRSILRRGIKRRRSNQC